MQNFKEVEISEIKFNPENPRVITDDKFRKLVQSIKEFPQMLSIRPIVVNGDMMVLGGNMRLKACQEAGLVKVPIIKADELTEEQQKEFIAKDNIGYGDWDWDKLANGFDVEKLEAWGLDIPGFMDGGSQEDDYEPPDEIQTDIKRGDLFELSANGLIHRVLCGDSTIQSDVEKLMGGEKADMVFTDPPYSVNYEKKKNQ